MIRVHFTGALKRFYPDLKEEVIDAGTVFELIEEIEKRYPGIRDYIVDEHGRCRRHVNIFIGEQLIQDRVGLSDSLRPGNEVFLIQALSGG
jgi:sulfur-carrier protein